jgi:cellobionic acid phosphorylase
MAEKAKPDARRCGFVEDGRRYVVRDLHLLDRADADLWNDRMYVRIDQRGRCDAWFLQPNQARYSEPLRCFYVRDDETGAFWSAPFEPVQAEPDAFEFSIGTGDLQWRVARDGVEVALRLVVPRDDTVELWTAQVANLARRTRRLSLYTFLPVGSVGLLAHRAWFDQALGGMIHEYFPYYVRWQDYYRLRERKNNVICIADARPTSFEINLNDFVGGRALHNPAGLDRERLARGRTYHEPSAAVFQFARSLRPGRSAKVNLLFGPAADRREMFRLKRRYLARGGVDRARGKVYAFLAAHAPTVRVETPDAELNHFLNHWQPRRALLIGRTARLTFCPQGRNVIQDAMGAVYTNPQDARRWLLRACAHQNADGWVPHGMKMHPGAEMMLIGAIPHRDTNTWAATAIHFYVAETGDWGILDEKVPFADERLKAAVYDHVCRALDWSLRDRTKRGLSRLGEGDWNDPLNMAGKAGRGESVWLTEALAFALDTWSAVAERRGDTRRARRYRREAGACRRAVNRYAWKGRWYARGTTDAGRWFGVARDKEGRIYLNAQSWAIICGAAKGKRIDACVAAVNRHLMTPAGPMTLHPPFQGMREDVGKLTQKAPGTGENGSVYCHAVTFYAYALFVARRGEEAFRVLRNLLTGTRDNPIRRSGQLPLYVPNFFRGTGSGRIAGRSSHAANTGTSAWYYRTAVSMLLGVRGELDGLRIDPQLPAAWRRARIWRKWRGAEFDIDIRRGRRADRVEVVLDGRELPDNLIPPQTTGGKHSVGVTLPR